jgi:hypothetical protein
MPGMEICARLHRIIILTGGNRIIEVNAMANCSILPLTIEFGLKPYKPAIPFANTPVSD